MLPTPLSRRLLAACLPALALLSSCGDGDPAAVIASARTTAPQTAGAEACMDCHAEVVQSYARTGMARALGPIEPGELEGFGELAAGDSGYHYGFLASPDGRQFVLTETHEDHPAHALAAQAVMGIGAGELDRSIAVLHGASTYFAPIEVLTVDGGRRLALAPGEMMQPGGRLGFPITAECLGCHTDNLPAPDYPLDLLPDPRSWSPRGISCAGCHGTQAELDAHVSWQESDLVGGAAPGRVDPLLRLGGLQRHERLSVCARCHLQGDARLVLEDGVLGPPPVGGDLLESRALFVAAEPTDEVGFVSQVERLVASACFLESQLDCATCHDPHQSLHEPGPAARVRASCLDCHQATPAAPDATTCSRDHAADADFPHANRAATLAEGPVDCVACHMPLTGVFDVADVLIHDHHIRRDGSNARPPSTPDELRFAESASGDWRRFTWPDQPRPEHVDELGLWMLAFASAGHAERAATLVDEPAGETAESLAMYHHVRASLLESLGRHEEAAADYLAALERDPDLAPSVINLGLLMVRTDKADEAEALLTRLLERYPRASGALRNRALARSQLGDSSGALTDLEAAFTLTPDPDLARALASALRQAGQLERAREFARIATQLDPTGSD
ncbi:MAG: tetratricopeptide repeat protein [Planctomycetota bacterium]|nr:tetratricopeptide repeat protein [Planctomycetota bacterium]